MCGGGGAVTMAGGAVWGAVWERVRGAARVVIRAVGVIKAVLGVASAVITGGHGPFGVACCPGSSFAQHG